MQCCDLMQEKLPELWFFSSPYIYMPTVSDIRTFDPALPSLGLGFVLDGWMYMYVYGTYVTSFPIGGGFFFWALLALGSAFGRLVEGLGCWVPLVKLLLLGFFVVYVHM